jgi:hypothetical protein
MFKKSFIGIAILSIALVFASCGGTGNKDNKDKKDTVKVVKKDTVKINKAYTDIAKFISGMPVDSKSDLFELSKDASFKSFATASDTSWAKLDRKRLVRMRKWSDTVLTDLNKDIKTLFYPFSGPDFLHAHTFFPKAKKYIMFGLEPVGNIPDMKKLPKEKLSKYFNAINTSIGDVLNLTFFQTIQMSKELNSELISGSLPIILLFVARTGHEIVDIKPIEIDKDGKFVHIDAFKNLKGEASYNKGAEITYVDKGDTVVRKIYYFSADVSDDGLKKNANCTKFFETLENNVITMVKSASYLMHSNNFSTVRNTILAKSKAFLQDDSGISYKFIDQTKWDVQLFGTYTGPIPLFVKQYEKDLKDAYAKGKPKPINFQYGYGSHCGLLLAKKK